MTKAPTWSVCRDIVRKITSAVIAAGLPHDVCLNVNIPKVAAVNGIKITRAARGFWTEEYADYTDPHGGRSTGSPENSTTRSPTALTPTFIGSIGGYASVVPCRPDQSATDEITHIGEILK